MEKGKELWLIKGFAVILLRVRPQLDVMIQGGGKIVRTTLVVNMMNNHNSLQIVDGKLFEHRILVFCAGVVGSVEWNLKAMIWIRELKIVLMDNPRDNLKGYLDVVIKLEGYLSFDSKNMPLEMSLLEKFVPF